MNNLELELLSEIQFTICGDEHTVNVGDVATTTTLNQYLRETAHLTGTKKMCLEGGCGSCIVAVEEVNPITKKVNIMAVNSCLVRLLSCHGWKISTNDGISQAPKYHPIQKILAEQNGSQCGFCSSGMVMNMYALYESGPITEEQIENSFGGNICRCTGYRPILQAFKMLISNKNESPDIEEYVPCYQRNCQNNCNKQCTNKKSPIGFQLLESKSKWMKVYNLTDLLGVIERIGNSSYKLIAGNTSQGVYRSKTEADNIIDISHTKELLEYTLTGDSLTLGANMSLNKILECFKDVVTKNSKFSYLNQVIEHINLVANVPVRNIGTLAGNLMIKYEHNEFPSDVFLLLETLKATIVIVDVEQDEQRVTPKDFLAIDMTNKVMKNVILRGLDETYKFGSYKIMPKAQNSHAIVNAGFLFKMNNSKIMTARIVFGNINPTFVHAIATENFLQQKNLFDNNILLKAYQMLDQELKTDYEPPDPKPEFRKQLAISLFYKFVLRISPQGVVSSKHISGGTLLERPLSTGRQEFGTDKSMYPVTQPIIKLEALAQTSGRAEYIDDIPDRPGQLFGALVLAKAKANSIISSIDPSEALKLKDVVAFFDKNSIPGENSFTPKLAQMPVQEELFCSGTIQYYSQPIGIVIAKSLDVAENAAELIRVSYKQSDKKPLLTVQDVLNANATDRITTNTTFVRKKKGNNVKHVIKDDFYIAHQYHAHMELQCCNIIPTEDGLDIFASTQWLYITQLAAAAVLNIPTSKINVFVRRLGGGFGAKLSRNTLIATAAALAAYKLQKPVKMWMPLIKNMSAIGRRYPLYAKYEVGVNDSGVMQYLNADLYSDFGVGGNEPMDPLLLDLFENMYNTDTWAFTTNMVKTDTAGNCYCRSPGTLEGLAAIESIMENIAYVVNQDPLDVKLANMNKTKNSKLYDFITEMKTWSDVDNRKKDILEFNANNRWKKRGISIVPMDWDFEFIGQFVVLVSIFQGDGGVAVIHGGIECGQGINTKVAQACAYKFGIPIEKVSVKPSYNVVTPNSSMTGGSLTTEAICYALLKACDILLERMKPYKDKLTNPTWEDIVKACFDNFVQLTASSNFAQNNPDVQGYKIYGVCTAEVELDVLTGNHELLRVDIIEDIGESMNPLIDIGQTEGAFVMGIGYYTMEDLVVSSEGEVLSNRTWNYFIPGPKDIPVNFRIKFPENNPNPVGVLKTKAIAEPPTCLSVAVPLAIRNAIASARTDSDNSKPKWYTFNGCTNVENVFMNSLNDYNQYTL